MFNQSLFGGNNNQQQQNTSLFGKSQGTSLFGGNNSNSGTSLFGGNNSNSGTSLFGGNTNQQQGTSLSLFGGNNNNQQQGTSLSLFGGNNNNQQQQGTSLSLFGGNNNNQQQQGNSLFGSFGQNKSLSLGSNNSNVSMFSGFQNNTLTLQQQQQQQLQNQVYLLAVNGPWWYRELVTLQSAYRSGQGSKFCTMLYEVVNVAPDLLYFAASVPPAHIEYVKSERKRQIQQQMPWIDQRDWQKAEERNPDPSNWMPCPIVGIPALSDRVHAQFKNIEEQLQMLEDPPILKKLSKNPNQQGEEEHSSFGTWIEKVDKGIELKEQIDQCRLEHERLSHRLIKALAKLERLECRNSRGGRTESEIQFQNRVEKLSSSLSDSKGCKTQLSRISAQLSLSDVTNINDKTEIHSINLQPEEELAIFNLLESQHDAIGQLMKVIKKDIRDVDSICKRLSL